MVLSSLLKLEQLTLACVPTLSDQITVIVNDRHLVVCPPSCVGLQTQMDRQQHSLVWLQCFTSCPKVLGSNPMSSVYLYFEPETSWLIIKLLNVHQKKIKKNQGIPKGPTKCAFTLSLLLINILLYCTFLRSRFKTYQQPTRVGLGETVIKGFTNTIDLT